MIPPDVAVAQPEVNKVKEMNPLVTVWLLDRGLNYLRLKFFFCFLVLFLCLELIELVLCFRIVSTNL